MNRNTPVGEPADFYEHKPYGGKRLLPEKDLVGFVYKGKFEPYQFAKPELVQIAKDFYTDEI